jgi:hypothetical protein
MKTELKKLATVLVRMAPILAVIAVAWYGFLKLVAHPPLSTTPALIMVWSSVLLLIFGFYPKVFDRIKRLKIADFEIELEQVVAESATEHFLTIADVEDEYLFSQKAHFAAWGLCCSRLRFRPAPFCSPLT